MTTSELLARLPQWEREAEEYENKAAAIRQIIAGVKTLNGEAEAILTQRSFESHRTPFEIRPADEKGPRGREAVFRVMAEQPNRLWKVVELKRELLRRGWAPSPKAVEANIKRMRQLGEIDSVKYGVYKLAPQRAKETDVPENGERSVGEVRQ